jgi:hypothetical protein
MFAALVPEDDLWKPIDPGDENKDHENDWRKFLLENAIVTDTCNEGKMSSMSSLMINHTELQDHLYYNCCKTQIPSRKRNVHQVGQLHTFPLHLLIGCPLKWKKSLLEFHHSSLGSSSLMVCNLPILNHRGHDQCT